MRETPVDDSVTTPVAVGYNIGAIPLADGALARAGFTMPPAVGAVLPANPEGA